MPTMERRQTCIDHESQNNDINSIARAIAKHSGQWKILMWGISLLGGAVLVFAGFIWHTASGTKDVMVEIDKSFSSYMEMHMVETSEGFRRIGINSEMLQVHESRIDAIERQLDRTPNGVGK